MLIYMQQGSFIYLVRLPCADACKAAAANADTTATGAATALIGAAAQCVHLLYGLELPAADEGFTEGYQVCFP